MSFTIHHGDVLAKLREMPDASVHCVVTSPPYWGLRDYGTATWEGGSADCDHLMLRGSQGESGDRADRTHTQRVPYQDVCGRCGAVRVDKQLGLEKTPEEFVSKMVEVFREVRRVLRDDGTCWVNMGDCYATGAGAVGNSPGGGAQGDKWAGRDDSKGLGIPARADGRGGHNSAMGPMTQPNRMPIPGLKPKDLVGAPWRLAFALQADGWWLRQDIIWHKPAPMPESVKDRCTKAHEYIFLLTKSERYFYDAAAIAEPASPNSHARYARGRSADHKYADGGPSNQTITKSFEHMLPGNKSHKGTTAYENGDERHRTKGGLVKYAERVREEAKIPGVNPKANGAGRGTKQNSSFSAAVKDTVSMRNKRSVWTIASMPTPEAHFATFPLELPETCILAGCPEGGVVLDPFSGAGTTGLACLKHGRDYIGIELNQEYIAISMERARKYFPLLAPASSMHGVTA